MIKTDLGGHSGCKIVLCEPKNSKAFVRKISSNIDYNSRLKLQKNKQENYQSEKIKVPKIIGEGYQHDGLYYFDMEYVQGITLAEYIKNIEVSEINGVVDVLINDIVNVSNFGSPNNEVFFNKIESLRLKLTDLNNPIINEALDLLENHDWGAFKQSSCHGDMTLENIIVSKNNFYLIDFLDSFYDNWIMDLSTILQDIQCLWHYRLDDSININTLIRLIIMRDLLIQKTKEIMGKDYIEVYYALLLKLIRIYPYTKDKITYEFLNNKSKSIIKIINGFN